MSTCSNFPKKIININPKILNKGTSSFNLLFPTVHEKLFMVDSLVGSHISACGKRPHNTKFSL